jgi:hypothetical protein
MAKGQIPASDAPELISELDQSPADAEQAKGQTRVFGLKMLAGGALAAVLPFFGLTIKGLPAEGCMIVGLILFLIGLVALLASFSSNVNYLAVNGSKIVMWSIIGLFGLVLVSAAGFLLFIFGMSFFDKPQPAGRPNPVVAAAPAMPGPIVPQMAPGAPIPGGLPGANGAQALDSAVAGHIEAALAKSQALKARVALEAQQAIAAAQRSNPRNDLKMATPPAVADTPNPIADALKAAAPADLDALATKYLTTGNADEFKGVLVFLRQQSPNGAHDQVSAAVLKRLSDPSTTLDDKKAISQLFRKWALPATYPAVLEWAKTTKGEERYAAETALQSLRSANPNATEIIAPNEELKQLALVWLEPGESGRLSFLKDLAAAKSPPRTPGLAELLEPSTRSENAASVQTAAAQAIQIWGDASSYQPLLERAKAAINNDRVKARVPLTALRQGLPMAAEIQPLDQELVQISLVWMDGKPFPGAAEHLQALKDAKPKKTSNELTKVTIPYLDEKLGAKINVLALGVLLRWGNGSAIAPITKRFENEKTPEVKKFADVVLDILTKRLEAIKKAKQLEKKPADAAKTP